MVQHTVKGTVGRAFCGDKLKTSDTNTFKTLLEKECKVLPSCGKSVCLSMNTKANFQKRLDCESKANAETKTNDGSKIQSKKGQESRKPKES